MTVTATDKQVAFITKLTTEKDWTAAPVAPAVQAVLGGVPVSRKEASSIIEALLALGYAASKKTQKTPAAKVEDGFYVLNDTIYKVQTSPNSGHSYAKELTASGSFQFIPGAVAKLVQAEKLTLELAKKYGKLYGMCVVCGRTLTDETSISQGIGPICAGKF